MKVSDYTSYAYFEYEPYLFNNDGEKDFFLDVDKRPFDLGDIVYIKKAHSLGVVIGCIDYAGEELRTDMEGMQSFADLELATQDHFFLPDVCIGSLLMQEFNSRVSNYLHLV